MSLLSAVGSLVNKKIAGSAFGAGSDYSSLDTEAVDTRHGKHNRKGMHGAPSMRMAGANLGLAIGADILADKYLAPHAKNLGTKLGQSLIPVGHWIDKKLGNERYVPPT